MLGNNKKLLLPIFVLNVKMGMFSILIMIVLQQTVPLLNLTLIINVMFVMMATTKMVLLKLAKLAKIIVKLVLVIPLV